MDSIYAQAFMDFVEAGHAVATNPRRAVFGQGSVYVIPVGRSRRHVESIELGARAAYALWFGWEVSDKFGH